MQSLKKIWKISLKSVLTYYIIMGFSNLEKRYKEITGSYSEKGINDVSEYIGSLLHEIKKGVDSGKIVIPSQRRLHYRRTDCVGCWGSSEEVSGEIYLTKEATINNRIIFFDERGRILDHFDTAFPLAAFKQQYYSEAASQTLWELEEILKNSAKKSKLSSQRVPILC